jgi:hypothetical protein
MVQYGGKPEGLPPWMTVPCPSECQSCLKRLCCWLYRSSQASPSQANLAPISLSMLSCHCWCWEVHAFISLKYFIVPGWYG